MFVVLLLCAWQPSPAQEQLPDMEVMQYWSRVKIVRYHIVGVYQAKTDVIGDVNWIGYADVTDNVTIDLDWKIPEACWWAHPLHQREVRKPGICANLPARLPARRR